MAYTTAAGLAKARAEAQFQKYQSDLRAENERAQRADEAQAAMAVYRNAVARRDQKVADTVAEFRPRINKEVGDFLNALSAADDDVIVAKSAAQAAFRAAGGQGSLRDDSVGGGRIANTEKVKATVNHVLDLAVRNELSR